MSIRGKIDHIITDTTILNGNGLYINDNWKLCMCVGDKMIEKRITSYTNKKGNKKYPKVAMGGRLYKSTDGMNYKMI